MPITAPAGPLRRLTIALAAGVLTLLCAAPAHAHAQTAGLQTHLLWSNVDSAGMDRQLDAAKSAGAGIVRVDVGWAALEGAGKGQWSNWALGRVDSVVQKAEARGVKVLFTLWETPCWASSAPDDLKQSCSGSWWDRGVERYAPVRPSDYADALAFLVRRYGSRVAAWEIWNEPNSSDFFKASDPVTAYANMVKAAYPPAKAADPSTTIVAGSLMWADYTFADRLFQQGIKGYFDAFSIHPYSDDRSPLDPGLDAWIKVSFIRGVPAVRDVQLKYGDTKALWLTEFGWSTSTVRNSSSWINGVSESTQATYVGQALTQVRSWPYVDVAIYYTLVNTGGDPASKQDNFGLLRPDFTAKPAYAAFRTGATALAQATASPTPTPTPTPISTPTPTPTPTPISTPTNGKKPPKKRSYASISTAIRHGSGVRSVRARRLRTGLRVSGRALAGRRVSIRVYSRWPRHRVLHTAVKATRRGTFASVIRRRALQRPRQWRVVAG